MGLIVKEKKIGFLGNPGFLPAGSKENTGNVVHWYAARALFRSPGQIHAHLDEANLAEIRKTYTHLGYAAATMLNVNSVPQYIAGHEHAAEFIEKLDLPVCALGLGCQAQLGQSVKTAEVDSRSIRLLRAIADRSALVGVRGEFTAALCEKYGVRNVKVLGCQSSYRAGVENWDTRPVLKDDAPRVVANLTGGSDEREMLRLVMGSNADIIGQNDSVEEGIKLGKVSRDDYENNPNVYWAPPYLQKLFAQGGLSRRQYFDYIAGHFEKFYTFPEWVDHIRTHYDFCFGTRFHGNMVAFHAGVPALWVVHDMRTRELCDHLGLPNVNHGELPELRGLAEMIGHCDYSGFWTSFPRRLKEFMEYLRRNGVAELLAQSFVEKSSRIVSVASVAGR